MIGSYILSPENTYANRGEMLGGIVPRIVDITTSKGKRLRGFPGYSVEMNGKLLISSDPLSPTHAALSVYSVLNDRLLNVFTAQAFGFETENHSAFVRHSGSRVGVTSWCRGSWEELIVFGEPAPPFALETLLLRHHSSLRPYRDDEVDAPAFAAYL